MNTYLVYYRGKNLHVEAKTAYEASLLAAKLFKAKKAYEVAVVLAAIDGHPVSMVLS